MEWDRRWSSHGNLTLPLSEEGLYFVVEGAVHGKVEFVEDPSLKDYAVVDFDVEYDDWVFGQTKFCLLENISGTGIGIFVSDNGLLHGSILIWFQGPKYTRRGSSTLAEVTVRIPKFSKPFEIENFAVSVPILKVHFGDINVKPGSFSVMSVTGEISINVGPCLVHYATRFSFHRFYL